MSPNLELNATIEQSGIQRFVLVPKSIATQLGKEKYIPVVATIGDHKARATMVPAGKGDYRIFLNSAMRKAAGADTGEPIHLTLAPHLGGIELPIPDFFQAALEGDPAALAVFLNLTPGRRNEFIKFVGGVKKPEARQNRIAKSLEMLRKC